MEGFQGEIKEATWIQKLKQKPGRGTIGWLAPRLMVSYLSYAAQVHLYQLSINQPINNNSPPGMPTDQSEGVSQFFS